MLESSKMSVAANVVDILGKEICKLHENIEILSKRLEPFTYNNRQKDVEFGAIDFADDMPEYFKSIHYKVEQLERINHDVSELINKLGL